MTDIIFAARNVTSKQAEVSKERFSQLLTQFLLHAGYQIQTTETYEIEPLANVQCANREYII